MIRSLPQFTISSNVRRLLLVLMVIGLVTFVLGLFLAPERIWPNVLIAVFYVLSLSLGAAFLVAVHYASNAGWGTAIRRVPEAVASALPVAAAAAVLLILGVRPLYEWSHELVVAQDVVLQGKRAWLNEPFFIARLVGYFLIWFVLTRVMVKNSVQQDRDGDLKHTHRNVRNAVLFLILGMVTFSLASFDLLMSLQPHWYSTVFGLLSLSGMFLNGLAIVTIFVIVLRYQGYKRVFTDEHLHDLGRLLMSFSIFWVYMWVSQHMLIWYSNIPEETSYYIFRHFGGWGSLSFLNVLLNWLIPFLVLLPGASKRSDKVMLQACVIILIGRWLDLFIMVMPVTFGATPTLGVWEIGFLVGLLALFFYVVLRNLSRVPNLVPINDPYLVESLPEPVFEQLIEQQQPVAE